MKKFENAELEVLEIENTANGCWFFHHEGEQLKGCITGHVYYETKLGPVQEEQPGTVEPGTDDDFTNNNSN